MPTWQKIIVAFIIMLYLIVNESERIKIRMDMDKQIKLQKSWVRDHGKIYTEHEHFYNGPPKPGNEKQNN